MNGLIKKLSFALLCGLPLMQGQAVEKKEDIERLFTLKVKPMLSEKCFGCHGEKGKRIKGGLDVTTREAFLKGGDEHSDNLIPGSSEKSFVVDAVKWLDEDFEMPPKENDRLSKEQIQDLETWINAGAPWPTEERQSEIRQAELKREHTDEGIIVKTSGGLADEWTFRRYKPEEIWAFQPVKKPALPDTGAAHPVDALIQAKLSENQTSPAPTADSLTLIRRATYDLTGLPPTAEEVAAFKAAYKAAPDKAWNNLIDQLLASPHYGERWGQHWLDVARYADTGGYSNDYERSNMWRYRDYVIRSLNQDKPYNQFIIEQIAGDELADDSLRGRISDWDKYQKAREKGDYNETESEWLIASSFLRIGPWDPAMVKAPQARQIYLDDVVNAVGQTFLATTMRCFKCHDHKFDPLPTKDYYRFYSAFAGTQLAERPSPFLSVENKKDFDTDKLLTKELLAFARDRVKELTTKREKAAKEWYKENNKEYLPLDKRKNLPDEEKPPRHVGLTHEEKGKLKVREQDVWIWNRRMERYNAMVQSVYNGPDPKFLNARKLRMDAKANIDWRPDSRILTGGAIEAPGAKVQPGVISSLGVPVGDQPDNYTLGDSLHGRRTALAKWIANERNPLTTRSIVNRIWQYHFGKAIAGNPNNFGVKGKKPTHPALLDWLASDFVENGWKIKRMHKLIMTSKTYMQAPRHPNHDKVIQSDPNNDLFAYFPTRRLSAEEIRDSMLYITGELNPEMGGLPARPEMNMEVALQPRMIQFSLAPAYQPSPTPAQRNRRSIYAYRVRGLALPFLETFNQPNPNDSCEERDAAAVSPQAFTMLNSDVVTDRSIAFASRLEKSKNNLGAKVTQAMKLALGRAPSSDERQKLVQYIKEMEAYHRKTKPSPTKFPTEITRSLVEEFTGEPFEYKEILPVFKNYTADKKAADVSPTTRALADMCLLLFNSHEFTYIY